METNKKQIVKRKILLHVENEKVWSLRRRRRQRRLRWQWWWDEQKNGLSIVDEWILWGRKTHTDIWPMHASIIKIHVQNDNFFSFFILIYRHYQMNINLLQSMHFHLSMMTMMMILDSYFYIQTTKSYKIQTFLFSSIRIKTKTKKEFPLDRCQCLFKRE